MNFYTNITRWGNNLLLREVVNGQRLIKRLNILQHYILKLINQQNIKL